MNMFIVMNVNTPPHPQPHFCGTVKDPSAYFCILVFTYLYFHNFSYNRYLHEPVLPRMQFLGSHLGSASCWVPDLPLCPDLREGRGGEAVSTQEYQSTTPSRPSPGQPEGLPVASWQPASLTLKGAADLGLTQALFLGRPTQDLAWFEGRDLKARAQRAARELFEVEGIPEYECYDASWPLLGSSWTIVRWLLWLLRQPRYVGSENGLYHVCDCEASRCRVRKARGDRRELIHVDRWRLQTPATMMESPYLAHLGADLGEKAFSTAAREKKAAVPTGGSRGGWREIKEKVSEPTVWAWVHG